MFRRPHPVSASVIAATLAALLVVTPVAAGAPQRDEIHDSDVLCGNGITFDIDLVVLTTERSFADRVLIHTVVDGSAIASTGTTIRLHHSWTTDIDFAKGTMTIAGLAFGARVEGTTIRRMDRGRLVLDLETGAPLFVAGTWPPGPFNPVNATCELIAAAGA